MKFKIVSSAPNNWIRRLFIGENMKYQMTEGNTPATEKEIEKNKEVDELDDEIDSVDDDEEDDEFDVEEDSE
jgi:hypothetical protein